MPLPINSTYQNILNWWKLHFTFLRLGLLFLVLHIIILIEFTPNVVFCEKWEEPHSVRTTLAINTDIMYWV